MNYQSKHVLVTGAGGFIGSHLSEQLVEAGAHVRALVHYNSLDRHGWLDESPLKPHMEIVAGDICDRHCVEQAMHGCQIVFHLAALIAIPYSYQAPASYVRTNVEGTLHVLEAARRIDVERLVHTSTSEVYGTALEVPIKETHPLQAQSPYSASKIAADALVESFYRSFGVPAVTVRPFNTFGPRQSARAVIPTIISQCFLQEVVRLGNLQATRDFNFVANTVDGFLRAGIQPSVEGSTIHFGSGREISIGRLASMIGELMGRDIPVEVAPERVRPGKSEVERLLADNTRAQELLQWQPRVDLEEGLRRTISWMEENLGRYRADVYCI